MQYVYIYIENDYKIFKVFQTFQNILRTNTRIRFDHDSHDCSLFFIRLLDHLSV